ncbi:MAG: thioredoxin family protein [Candidatus Nanoarchaeia archaeon]|jgi:thioredoxin-like negative regulator of GroEL|nr:thioredoxin family protein [Candidatus Nanoarchaeia archaeon]
MKSSSFQEFRTIIASLTLVEFWDTSCAPCIQAEPYLEILQKAYQGRCNIVKINILEEVHLIEIYHVTKLPTFVLFRNCAEIDRVEGFRNKDLVEKIIRSHL